jgi:hypothetical protein
MICCCCAVVLLERVWIGRRQRRHALLLHTIQTSSQDSLLFFTRGYCFNSCARRSRKLQIVFQDSSNFTRIDGVSATISRFNFSQLCVSRLNSSLQQSSSPPGSETR